jgi:hypothetical protein
MEDRSGSVKNALLQASMAPTGMATEAPRFSPPGSESQSVTDADVRALPRPVPPPADDRDVVLHGDGQDPGGGFRWAAGDRRWDRP